MAEYVRRSHLLIMTLLRGNMESLSALDITYLVALNASEESILNEFVWEFEKWKYDKAVVLRIIKELIEDDTILLAQLSDDMLEDLSKQDSLSHVISWEGLLRNDLILCLTESGETRWEANNWGISAKRADDLMF